MSEKEIKSIVEYREEKRQEKIEAIAEAKKLSPDSDWHLVQILAQEIESLYIVSNEKKPTAVAMRDLLTKVIEERYGEEPEKKEVLLKAIPSARAITSWRNRSDWEEAVWQQIRDTGLFSREKRAKIIDSLFTKASNGDTKAAQLWLTMSGDYSDRMNINTDETVEKYREINNVLFKKNK